MGLELGVDGLREAGFHEANGLGTLDIEKPFQVRRREMLHDRVMPEIVQHFVAVGVADVRGDEHEMQLALVGAQGAAASHERAGLEHERE
jgi:hypothetical protein